MRKPCFSQHCCLDPCSFQGSTNGVGPDDDDYPYKRILDLTDDEDAVIDAIQDPDVLKIQNGADFPESQLTAIHQAITGEGLEVVRIKPECFA